ncbi:hypothetical protein C4565_00605 [Candidatus Parcubacteria bacterium]|nr:MAG: hypothetical protein C4565_00605 [Candidatus Parcubacteria bacterium]
MITKLKFEVCCSMSYGVRVEESREKTVDYDGSDIMSWKTTSLSFYCRSCGREVTPIINTIENY